MKLSNLAKVTKGELESSWFDCKRLFLIVTLDARLERFTFASPQCSSLASDYPELKQS